MRNFVDEIIQTGEQACIEIGESTDGLAVINNVLYLITLSLDCTNLLSFPSLQDLEAISLQPCIRLENKDSMSTEARGRIQNMKAFLSAIKIEVYCRVVVGWLVGWLFGFCGISTFVGHSGPNSVSLYIYIQPKISKRILR